MSFINRDPTVAMTVETAQHFQGYQPNARDMALFERVQLNEERRLADNAATYKSVVLLDVVGASIDDAFWVTPHFPITITAVEVVAFSAVTGTSANVIVEIFGGDTIADFDEIVGETIVAAPFAAVLDTGALNIPASTLVTLATYFDTIAGGRGLSIIFTYTRD